MDPDSATAGQRVAVLARTGFTVFPLFHAAWLFALGIVAARVLWLRPGWVLIALVLVSVLWGVAALRAQRVIWLPVALLWCLLGAWCAEMEPHPAPAPTLNALSDGLLRSVEGTVVDAGPVRSEAEQNLDESPAPPPLPSQRIDLRVSSVEVVTDSDDVQKPVDGGVRLTIRWPQVPDRPFHCGERVRAIGRLIPPEVYHDPGAWSRAEFLLDQGITSTASLKIERIERLGQSGPTPGRYLMCRLGAWQHASSARLLALPAVMQHLPGPLRLSQQDAVMLAAMVTGDRTYLTHSLRVGFERTGSFHMLVVSGFHLVIVAGCIFWVARRLRIPHVPATLLTILASLTYALFTGFGTPVQRSLWMVAIYLLGSLLYRQRSRMNTIGFAALCLLAASPRSLFDSSLQMTLLAVVAIGGIAGPLLEGTVHPYLKAARDLRVIAIDAKLPPHLAQFRVTLRMIAFKTQAAFSRTMGWRVVPWLVRATLRMCELLVVACVVELAMTLPMAVYFHRITVFALPVNLLILPLLTFLMPAALVTLLALLIFPAVAFIPAMAVALLLHLGVGLVRLFGSLSFGDVRIATPLLWQSAAFCALLATAIVLARSSPSVAWKRRAACTALVASALAAVAPRPIQHPENALLVEAIDVGQGDSLLLITPDGKTLLVDAGGFGGGPNQAPQEFDIGEEVVSAALWSRGIRHLDVVALSHAHSDHMGGMPAILRNFHPDELWVGNNPRFGAYDALLAEAASLHIRLRSLRAGDGFPLGDTRITVFAPFRDYRPGPEPTNNDSLVLRVSYEETSVLLEGDAEAPIEQAMLEERGLQSTLLKIGHHGSVTSTRPEFLSSVAPQWAVISCGLRNRYGHPRPEVLEELQSARVRTLSTDINGATCFALDGRAVKPDFECGQGVLH
jgi:competence protein ComEC